jgi:hypothetical protein
LVVGEVDQVHVAQNLLSAHACMGVELYPFLPYPYHHAWDLHLYQKVLPSLGHHHHLHDLFHSSFQ